MYRKIAVLVMLSVYSFAAVGLPMHSHFCKGEWQHTTVFVTKDCASDKTHNDETKSPFACCLEKKAPNTNSFQNEKCCDDQSDFLQIVDEVLVKHQAGEPVNSEAIAMTAPTQSELGLKYVTLNTNQANEPPPLSDAKYLEHCSLIFYG